MKFNALLEGPAGTGKTTALRTLIPLFDTVQIIPTEPGIEAAFGEKGKYPTAPGKVGWHYIPPTRAPWEALIKGAKLVNDLDYDSLTKLKNVAKSEYQQFLRLLETLADYTDARTGKRYGPVDSWDENMCLAMDGLSGISTMAMQLVIGGRPVASQSDWQIAQNMVLNLLKKLVGDTKCSFILIAHIERESNEITGGSEITTSTLGRKLGPQIPQLFDEVILTMRQKSTFTWSTAETGVALKTRRLPITDNLPPDFAQIMRP